MKFHRVYIELTNVCGLKCTFCPPKTLPSLIMPLDFFEAVLKELKPYTKELAYHIVGDPLTLSDLERYLDLTCKHGFKVALTTSGYLLGKKNLQTLLHPAIKQINISLNSYNKNSMPFSFEAYMKPIIELCTLKQSIDKEIFINLRVWNMDDTHSEKSFNTALFAYLENAFGVALHVDDIEREKPKSLRLDEKIRLHFDHYFEWPSLESAHASHGTCQGLHSHIGILSNGSVVPCCLDKDGIISLGDLHVSPLSDILNSPKARAIRHGFTQGLAVESLCQKCTYKERFSHEML